MNNDGLSAGGRTMLRHEIHCDVLEEREARIRAEDAERAELSDLYSDMFKDRNGVRPRHVDFRTISLVDLRMKVEALSREPLPDFDEFV